MEIYKNVIGINLFGSAHVAKFAAIAMSKNKGTDRGIIIFISSVASQEGTKGQVAYGASKGALNGMVMPMARDLGKFGIRVVSIAPGLFETPMSDMIAPSVAQRLKADTPLGRYGKPDEFAHFACTVIENGYINGVTLRIDGAIKMSNF